MAAHSGSQQAPATQGKQGPPSWALPDADRCVIAKCTVRPKHGPLCGRHSRYARDFDVTQHGSWMWLRHAWGLEPLVPALSEAGWAWVMSLAAAHAGDNAGPPSLFVTSAIASQAGVSRADTMTLLAAPGWARYRLLAPWVPDELVLALADHSRPVEDRRTVALFGHTRSLPPEGRTLLSTDPDAEVRRPPPDDVNWRHVAEWRAAYSAGSEVATLLASPGGLTHLADFTTDDWAARPDDIAIAKIGVMALTATGTDLLVLLPVEQHPTWVGPRPRYREYLQRAAAGYVAYASPTTAVRDVAMALLSDGWDQTLKDLVASACALEGVPIPD
jgi:hypothetical protein